MRTPAPRPIRRLQIASLLLLAVGVATYVAALTGMRDLEHNAAAAARGTMLGALARHAELERLSGQGLWLCGAGLLTAVVATVATYRARRRAADPRVVDQQLAGAPVDAAS